MELQNSDSIYNTGACISSCGMHARKYVQACVCAYRCKSNTTAMKACVEETNAVFRKRLWRFNLSCICSHFITCHCVTATMLTVHSYQHLDTLIGNLLKSFPGISDTAAARLGTLGNLVFIVAKKLGSSNITCWHL